MTSCSEKLEQLWVFPRKCAKLVGADVFDPNFRFTCMTWAVIIVTNVFFVLSIYTIYVGLYIDNDWKAILKALCMVGSAVQGMFKLFTATAMQKEYRKKSKQIRDIFYIYEQKRSAYKTSLNNSTQLIRKFIKISAYMYVICTLIVLSMPVFYLILFGEKIFVMQFLIPGIDPSTHAGHLITITAHTTCILMGSFGNYAGDNFFFIFILHVPLWKNILRLKFEDLNEVALKTSDNRRTLPILLDILHWHQYYTIYTHSLSDIFFVTTFIQIVTTCMNIGMTVFITFLGEWPAGYSYLLYSFVILYAYCGLGTVVECSNDDVCDYVYNSCIWYELSIEERKMLMMMLRKAQCPTLLTVGDILPLSISTGVSVTKTIYSFLMMLFNYVDN